MNKEAEEIKRLEEEIENLKSQIKTLKGEMLVDKKRVKNIRFHRYSTICPHISYLARAFVDQNDVGLRAYKDFSLAEKRLAKQVADKIIDLYEETTNKLKESNGNNR